MAIKVFKPDVDKKDKFAVAVPTRRSMAIIQTYPDMKQLETGYKKLYDFASKGGITKPYPIELLKESGGCRILDGLVLDN